MRECGYCRVSEVIRGVIILSHSFKFAEVFNFYNDKQIEVIEKKVTLRDLNFNRSYQAIYYNSLIVGILCIFHKSR